MRTNGRFIIFTLSCILVFLAAACLAQTARVAPLDPAWLEYQREKEGPKRTLAASGQEGQFGYIPSPLDLSHLKAKYSPQTFIAVGYPSFYDLRGLGKLTPVKNQNPYGTCWAFAALGSLESCLLTGETNDFSENHLANLAGFDSGFNDGGNSIMAAAYLARWGGPVNESDDPYPNPGGSSTNTAIRKHVQQILFLPGISGPADNAIIKEAVSTYGAVVTYMYYGSSSYRAAFKSYYYNGMNQPNHAVAIVGWDDSFSKNSFNSAPPGDGAFIVRNSWGSGWGENGYFYVSYYDSQVGRDNSVFNNAEPTDNYDYIYQYDKLGWVTSLGYDKASAWGANVFSVSGIKTLQAVSLYATADDSVFEISVHKNVSSGNPRSGELLATQTNLAQYAGYHTLPLETPAWLIGATNVSIVVKFTTPGYGYPLPVEYKLSGYSSGAQRIGAGKSYYSSDGDGWNDFDACAIADNVKLCVKAFLNEAQFAPDAPDNLFASDGLYADKVAISWSAEPSAQLYELWRHTNGSAASAGRIASTSLTSYNDTDTEAGIIYHYWVKASNAVGISAFSDPDTGWRALSAPAGVAASDGTYANKVRIGWNPVAGADAYTLWRNTINSSATAARIKQTAATSYDDTGASPGVLYYYWVKSTNSLGESAFSGSAAGRRASPELLAPDGVAASEGVFSDRVLVSWNPVGGADAYAVWRNTVDEAASASEIAQLNATAFEDFSTIRRKIYYYWVKALRGKESSEFSAACAGWAACRVFGDYDGDGRADIAVYHLATGDWFIFLSGSLLLQAETLGGPGCLPAPGHYDDDVKFDLAVYNAEAGAWIIKHSESSQFFTKTLGFEGCSPAARDYDGDEKTDLTLYHELTGTWLMEFSATKEMAAQKFGELGYAPVPGDYDGDGKSDVAVYHEATGLWFIQLTGSDYALGWAQFGGPGYVPVSGDFDGDSVSDLAVYHEASGWWFIFMTGSSTLAYQKFGEPGYQPVPCDYDGDGKSDVAVYHEATGLWFIQLTGSDYALGWAQFGGPGYIPASR